MSDAASRPLDARSEPGLPALEQEARALLTWIVDEFDAERFALVSAFGPGSSVLLHMLADIAPTLPVIFIDTLHHFAETLRHVERVRERYGLNLRVHRPAPDLETFERLHGPRLWERDVDRYQHVAKVEPFLLATRSLDGWITGRRRDQSPTRASLPAVQGIAPTLVNPLAAWTRADVWRFIHAHGLPYNPLHDRGYTSVGDQPLTAPISSDEHERAGRWRGTDRLECGIHPNADWQI
ncbi:MAG: phosphoadenylyl-sulfate reductase [Gemmatimonadota bacterium]